MASPDIEPVPPREAWEEPAPDAWTSHLGGLGLETLALAAGIATAVGGWKLFGLVQRLAAEPTQDDVGRTIVILLWCVLSALAAALIVFVWKRLGGLALIGAMLTDHGRVARLGGRPPIWLDERPEKALRLAHLSDLHVTEGDNVRLVERSTPGGSVNLAALLARPEIRDTDAILITGDITDRGTERSWQHALDLIARAGLEDRVILVPGNHDLALLDPWSGWQDFRRWRRSDRFGVVQLANLLKFCQSFARTGGGRLGSVLGEHGPIPFRFAWIDVESGVRSLLHALPGAPVPRGRLGRGFFSRRAQAREYERRIETARRALLALFPVAVPIPGCDSVVFVLNSCTPISRHPATNALGRIGWAQYRRLERLARFFPQPLKLVGLHHHVVRRGEERGRKLVHRIFAKLTVLGDARPLIRFCRRHRVRAVLNGHRHLSYKLRLPSGTVLMAAPSSTLGDDLAADPRPQFERYDIAPAVEPPTVGIWRQVIRLAPPPTGP